MPWTWFWIFWRLSSVKYPWKGFGFFAFFFLLRWWWKLMAVSVISQYGTWFLRIRLTMIYQKKMNNFEVKNNQFSHISSKNSVFGAAQDTAERPGGFCWSWGSSCPFEGLLFRCRISNTQVVDHSQDTGTELWVPQKGLDRLIYISHSECRWVLHCVYHLTRDHDNINCAFKGSVWALPWLSNHFS